MLQRSLEGLIKLHHRLVAEIPLGSPAAVVVMGAGQGHPHGGEGGVNGHQGAQQCAEELDDQG